MSLNCKEIDVVLSELDLDGSFVQEIVQPNFDSIAIYTYKPGVPKTVFVSLAGGECRINETRRKITKNEKPLRFNEMLKSKIKGAKIVHAEQIGEERIIKIELEKAGAIFVMPKSQEKLQVIQNAKAKRAEQSDSDEPENERFFLYIRLWSNAGNIFLCDGQNIILDSFFRRPAKNEKSGEPFVLPEKRTGPQKTFSVRTFDDVDGKTFSEKIDNFYSENAAHNSLQNLLEEAEKWYNSHKSRLTAAIERLEEKRKSFLEAGQYKHQGDMILSFGHLIDGSSAFIEAQDWENDGKTIRIKIDPKKSAQENASDYYERYKKATSGLENLEHDIALSKKSLADLDAQYEKMVLEKNPIKLEQILRKTQTPKQQKEKNHPGLAYFVDGWTIIVGRDANENDELLRHTVKGSDMWLHARDYHGGYVFIKNRPGKTVPLEILLYAGNLAVYYSKARKNAQADLYYTQVKHLRRAKNGPKGLVLPTNEKNLFIKLDEEKLRKLEEYFVP